MKKNLKKWRMVLCATLAVIACVGVGFAIAAGTSNVSVKEDNGQNIETIIGSNVYYTVHDSDSDAYLYDGYTDKNGQFTLKAGQYARFEVADGTQWLVYETPTAGYTLVDVTDNVNDQSAVVQNTNGYIGNDSDAYILGTIIVTVKGDDGSVVVGAEFDLYKDGVKQGTYTTDDEGTITIQGLKPGSYYLTQTSAPDGYKLPNDPSTKSVTITGDSLSAVQLTVIDPVAEVYNVKYAVSIYGIKHDVDEAGNTLGLTFGPATGKSYISTYDAHLTKDEYESGDGYCIHWMAWTEIAEQSKKGPEVFQDCLENGCTHSVLITLNDTLLNTSYEGQMDDGDGAGMLYNSIKSNYRKWNSSGSNTGGWPASQIRAVLNGEDENKGSNASYALDADKCLFSCFPDDLQNLIVSKTVKSDTVYNKQTEENNKMTYDKLWLFSEHEMGFSSRSTGFEGDPYERLNCYENMGYSSVNSMRIGYYESGSCSWWLRSPATSSDSSYYVNTSGGISSYYTSNDGHGVAPGFCFQ